MTDSPADPVLALWATNIARPVDSLEAWAALVDERLEQAAKAGAWMLVMPEYASVQWLSFAPGRPLPMAAEIAWMAERADAALAALKPLVERHHVALLAGTLPVAAPNGGYVNRAHVLLPGGATIAQDKLSLTPDEQHVDGWNLKPGRELNLFRWRGLTWAVTICLDVEQPDLARHLQEQGVDVLLVPSMTETLAGYHRVFDCAKARAVELMTCVVACGTVGDCTAFSSGIETNISGAAAFVPCEPTLGDTGRWGTALPPRATDPDDGPCLITPPLPTTIASRLRQSGTAAVWQGPWSADHITIRTLDPQ
ncbi:nitrilase-related carbon-nitrogen hydrolase [Roseospirillum parvum]|uniref:Predicted amidohydrolase n=1 Tax=Roseospirillum parvum TaxID=83401 RepID=A0A1G7TQH4_9PROT|nr:nitrilase-related carbon-nitrogen hydrolase [Roseospirillum parvum]SDG36889.1 Predicted amidohydrolase [Roseospirillum parvum]